MKRLICGFAILVLLYPLSAQEMIAQKESLVSLELGAQSTQVSYSSSEEGFFSAGSPFIDRLGRVIFYNAIGGKRFIKIDGSGVSSIPYRGNLDEFRIQGSRFVKSQQGLIFDGQVQEVYYNDQLFEYRFDTKGVDLVGSGYNNYPAPWGAILYSEKQKAGIAIVFSIEYPSEEFSVVSQTKLKAWLPTQPGGFSIGEDGLLYRNGILWSAQLPSISSNAERYLGKLISGHNIWVGAGMHGQEKEVYITNSRGDIESRMDIPWAYQYPLTDKFRMFNYGVGPWGEFYYLLAPADYLKPAPGSTAELVVVRNHLKYFGRLNDGGVRLRSTPNTSGDILGTYPNKTGFRILEKGDKEETIGGQKNVWYKVRLLDGKEGWFFGAFVHNLYDGPNGLPPPWPNVADW